MRLFVVVAIVVSALVAGCVTEKVPLPELHSTAYVGDDPGSEGTYTNSAEPNPAAAPSPSNTMPTEIPRVTGP
jgi:hypothetical protein